MIYGDMYQTQDVSLCGFEPCQRIYLVDTVCIQLKNKEDLMHKTNFDEENAGNDKGAEKNAPIVEDKEGK